MVISVTTGNLPRISQNKVLSIISSFVQQIFNEHLSCGRYYFDTWISSVSKTKESLVEHLFLSFPHRARRAFQIVPYLISSRLYSLLESGKYHGKGGKIELMRRARSLCSIWGDGHDIYRWESFEMNPRRCTKYPYAYPEEENSRRARPEL